jgi:hypothetical protein
MAESYSIDFSEEESPPAIPAPGGKRTRLIIGIAGLVVLVGIVVLLVWLLGGAGYTRLTPQNPSLSHPDGLRVAITSEQTLQVRVDSIPRELFMDGSAGEEWQTALDALPPFLDLKSPIYTIDARGSAPVMVEVAIPNDAQPYATLDLYRWDAEAGQWFLVAGHVDPAADVIRTDELPPNVAVFQTRAATPLVSTILEPGQTLGEGSSALNLVMPAGVTVNQDGSFSGALAGGWQLGVGYAVAPVVRLEDSAAALALFSNEAALTAHRQTLVDYIVGGGYNGVAIDYRNLPEEAGGTFSQFIADLGADLDAYNRWLIVILPQPGGEVGAWDTGAYDWRAIGEAADIVMLRLPDSPGDYASGGDVAYLLSWAVGEINRYRLHIITSSLSVDEVAGVATSITYDEAISRLGTVTLETPLPEGVSTYTPDQALTFDLTGPAVPTQDPATGVYRYTYNGDDGQAHQVWIVTAASLRNRLDLAAAYNLGGVSIANLLADGNDAGMAEVVTEFRVARAPSFPAELVLAWQVSGPGDFAQEGTTGLGTPFAWTASGEGDFTVSAQLVGARVADRGSVAFQVAPEETPTPTPAPVVVAPAATTTTEAPAAAAPVAPAGAIGGFELGGQVNGAISHPDQMHHAGMTWVKFQVAWSPGMSPDVAAGMIESAHANGFQVLLSVTGQNKFPGAIDFDSLIPFLEGLARLGPDAIEVWNEQNLDREWPHGQISATDYVNRILAPAYNAINSVDSSIMVISGAPSPTGYFGGCADAGCDDWLYTQQMVAAGAANYMDCVGAHYNSGATSPSIETGHPADGGDHHYTWYYPGMVRAYSVFGRPICWTELGYVTPEGYGALPGNFSWGSQTTVAQQAAWLAEAAQIGRSQGNVRLMIIWNVDFLNWDPNDPMAGYAIIRPGGGCPACDALAAVMP